MVGARVLAFCRAHHGHRGVHCDERPRMALLASGHHRLDRTRTALGRGRVRPRRRMEKNRYWLLVAFPACSGTLHRGHSSIDNFVLAAVPAVVFLSAATLWTGIRAAQNIAREETARRQHAARLDAFPALGACTPTSTTHFCARGGAWSPWGYYIDILFLLAVGAGILLLVNADLAEAGCRSRHVRTRGALSQGWCSTSRGGAPTSLARTAR